MKLTQRVSNVFIISAELNLLLGTSLLSQKVRTRVEQNFSFFFSGLCVGCSRLIFASATPAGCSASANQLAATRFRNGGHSPIRASNSSPARIGPTPEGVPVKITSPGSKVSDWLAKEIISAGG
jgi:hypothetical protein